MNNDASSLFKKTRWRLTQWYAGIISIVLAILGLGVYEAIVHAHRITLEQELKTVAETLHDQLQLSLSIPNQLDDDIVLVLPNFCRVDQPCISPSNGLEFRLNSLAKNQYYIQLFTLSGKLIGVSGKHPSGIIPENRQKDTKIVIDDQNMRYLQTNYLLHTQSGQNWGYLQVGRSLKDFDLYLQKVGLILLLGLPLAVILVGFSAWWLSGLAMQPIYQSYRQIQQFTADAAHELRTPLAAIQATLESTLMLPTLSEQEAKDTLYTLERQNKRLSHLVADLLLLTRLDRQLTANFNNEIQPALISLNDLISDVVEELSPLAFISKIKVKYQIKTRTNLEILGYTEKIYCLLFNLITNAIQYTPEEGKVTIVLEQNQQFAVITVQDTGIGIDSKDLARIFDRFYRVNQARTRDQGGSGLGLSIAKAIAQSHHATIEVSSKLGEGTVFTVCFPLKM